MRKLIRKVIGVGLVFLPGVCWGAPTSYDLTDAIAQMGMVPVGIIAIFGVVGGIYALRWGARRVLSMFSK